MENIIWALDDLVPFIKHPDGVVRHWVADYLNKHYPHQAGPFVLDLLDDEENFASWKAITLLEKTGEGEKYGPPLLEVFKQGQNQNLWHIAEALAKLAYEPAIPALINHIHTKKESATHKKYLPSFIERIVASLAQFKGEDIRQALWDFLQNHPDSLGGWISLFEVALPEDIPNLIAHYRTKVDKDNHHLSRLAQHWDLSDLFFGLQQDIEYEVDPAEMLETSEWYLETPLNLSQKFLTSFDNIVRRKFAGFYPIAATELRQHLEKQGHDIESWFQTWQNGGDLRAYQRRIVLALSILDAFAQQPRAKLSQRIEEGCFGLSLFMAALTDKDEVTYIEQAEDKLTAVLSLLTTRREQVSDIVVEQAVAQGKAIIPPLIEVLDRKEPSYSTVRALQALEKLAEQNPADCEPAIPAIMALLNRDQWDDICELIGTSLATIGPAAVPALQRDLRQTDDSTRQIYFTGALGDIGTESCAKFLVDVINSGAVVEEIHLIALLDTGSAEAIVPLYTLWQQDTEDRLLAEHLLILCQLHGIDKPEIAIWREISEREHQRQNELMDMFSAEGDITEEVLSNLKGDGDGGFSLPDLPPLPTWQIKK